MFSELRTGIGHQALLNLLNPALNGELSDQDQLHEAVITSITSSPAMLSLLFHSTQILKEKPELALALMERAFHTATSEKIRKQLKMLALKFNLDVVFKRKRPEPPITLTPSQSVAFSRLRQMAHLFFKGPTHHGVTLRINPLMVGKSGVGKTHLAAALAESLEVPFLRLTVGDWLVSGSRCDPTTFQTLQRHLSESSRLVLFLDELEKFKPDDSNWARSVLTEVFSVLDRRVNYKGTSANPWTQLHHDRLKQGTFIIGAGTWQEIWKDTTRSACGFAGDQADAFDESAFTRSVRKAQVIPDELVNRFNDDWLILRPYTAADFVQIVQDLKLPLGVLDPHEAAASGMNFRAVERACTNHALKCASEPPREVTSP